MCFHKRDDDDDDILEVDYIVVYILLLFVVVWGSTHTHEHTWTTSTLKAQEMDVKFNFQNKPKTGPVIAPGAPDPRRQDPVDGNIDTKSAAKNSLFSCRLSNQLTHRRQKP
ncbi:hypothetical protein KAR91_45895 [Candidatus Pacearchaeota archaeon]|nr:hypothetical protein [Candidatus Pacearchaeota archaeon]